jgi:uncharacterized phage protein (TIGR02216 family)
MKPFPWKDAIAFGLGILRLPPEQFWRMTPRELGAAWSAVVGERTGPMDRPGLEQLMEQFPDGR